MTFLKKVYRYNKLLFGGMLFFMAVQLFCFYKGGMVFTPFYNYGMYSEVMHVKSEYEINVVGDLKGSDFTPQAWDKIHYTLGQYQTLDNNDSLYTNEVKRLVKKAHLPAPTASNFITFIPDFKQWYPRYLNKADSINWHTQTCNWNSEALIPSSQH